MDSQCLVSGGRPQRAPSLPRKATMQIAVQIDVHGRIASPYETNIVRIFDGAAGHWTPLADIAFGIDPENTLAETKRFVRALADQLGDCRVYLARESRGLIFTILEDEFGFHTWKSRGVAHETLDALAQAEVERMAMPPPPPPPAMGCGCGDRCGGRYSGADTVTVTPIPLGDGRLGIDLAEILKSNPALNSRQVLFPVLEKRNFSALEIRCDHVPRWFSQKIDDLRLRADIRETAAGVAILVTLASQEATL